MLGNRARFELSRGGAESAQVRTADPATALSWWAKVGLGGIVLSLLAPLVGLAGLWAAAGLGRLVALGLDSSGARLPRGASIPSWDLRFVYVLAAALLGVRMGMSVLPRPRWKLAGLGPTGLWLLVGGLLSTATGTLLACERHVLDLSDDVHLASLAATAAWASTTTIWLLVGGGYSVLRGLRFAARRSATASGITAVVGVTGLAVATPLLANPELVDADSVYRDAPVIGSVKNDLYETGNMLAAQMVERASPHRNAVESIDPPRGSREPEGMFAACMEAVIEPRPFGGSNIRDAVMRTVRANYPSVAHEVEDLVRSQMIDMCVDGRDRSRDELQALLYKMTRNAAVSRVRKLGARTRYWSQNLCLIDPSNELADFEEVEHREVTVARLLEKLPPEKRALLEERYLQGLDYAEMAARRGKSASAVSRATVRAKNALRELASSDCR